MGKVLCFIGMDWAFGSLHAELAKYLHARGMIFDLLDWSKTYSRDEIQMMSSYYDYFCGIVGETWPLTDVYGIPHNKIIVIAHGDYDLHHALASRPPEEMDKFAGYAVLSDYLRGVSTELGIQRIPRVVRLGVNFHRFYAPVSTELKIVGYGGSMFRDDNGGVDLKRGSLVKQATENAGLAFNPSGKFHFLAMPEYYRHVDAVIVSSSREGYGLPAMEAAAAGRLVISTSVGAFTDQASLGAGILAPNDPEGFVEFVTEKLIEFKLNANSYFETCVAIQSAARRLDWQFVTDEWIDLLTFPQSARGR